MKRLLLVVALAAGCAYGFAACGDDHKTHVTPAECEPIANACHPSITPEGQECHESAEGVWTAAECMQHEADCLAKCKPDAGP